jgi:GTPase SAR1 family protein
VILTSTILLTILTKKLLNSLLNSYNLTSIVDFPTRIESKSLSAIDNIFIDYSRKDKHYICPFFNGLSDHDGQLLQFRNVDIPILINATQTYRKFDKPSILEFKLNLSFESWDDIFDDNDVNVLFKYFLSTYLRLFYASFPLKFHRKNNNNSTPWITPYIKMQCNLKRALYLLFQKYNISKIKNCFKALSKSLFKNVLEAKRSYYNNLLSTSDNKI